MIKAFCALRLVDTAIVVALCAVDGAFIAFLVRIKSSFANLASETIRALNAIFYAF
jgi:hypothetical protein